ncbi:MAG: DNA gyrase inhibitor YacG [Pseudomonadota bacterium]
MVDKVKSKVSDSQTICRVCGAPLEAERDAQGPFCSSRCRMQDLSKWFGENYRIASTPSDHSDRSEGDTEEAL